MFLSAPNPIVDSKGKMMATENKKKLLIREKKDMLLTNIFSWLRNYYAIHLTNGKEATVNRALDGSKYPG